MSVSVSGPMSMSDESKDDHEDAVILNNEPLPDSNLRNLLAVQDLEFLQSLASDQGRESDRRQAQLNMRMARTQRRRRAAAQEERKELLFILLKDPAHHLL
ncbi:uncharacterized protein LOC135499228 [Lineus longissimus]|uniref:uncharacterized protein LOC135499228 n=1 Tax=Lineus longissimus TaxID=88925 RepID=UPI00315D66C6